MIVVDTDLFSAVRCAFVFNADVEFGESFRGHVGKKRLVGVEDQNAALMHTVDDLHFCVSDAFAGAEIFHMGAADIGDHGDVGLSNMRKVRNFALVVHAHFQEERFVLAGHVQYGQGESDLIVEIALGNVGFVFGAEDGEDKLFGRCFSDASRNGKRDGVEKIFVRTCESAECFGRVFHDDAGDGAVFGNVFHDGKYASCLFCGGNEAVTVKIFSAECEECLSRFCGTGVYGNAVGKRGGRCRCFSAGKFSK